MENDSPLIILIIVIFVIFSAVFSFFLLFLNLKMVIMFKSKVHLRLLFLYFIINLISSFLTFISTVFFIVQLLIKVPVFSTIFFLWIQTLIYFSSLTSTIFLLGVGVEKVLTSFFKIKKNLSILLIEISLSLALFLIILIIGIFNFRTENVCRQLNICLDEITVEGKSMNFLIYVRCGLSIALLIEGILFWISRSVRNNENQENHMNVNIFLLICSELALNSLPIIFLDVLRITVRFKVSLKFCSNHNANFILESKMWENNKLGLNC